MLRELMDMWKSDKCEELCKAIDEFAEMISGVEFVFTNAWAVFSGEKTASENKAGVLARDIEINKHERHIRRLLAEHLSINPRMDVPGCLALMSLVKDAERMGDYAKNILDLAEELGGSQKDFKYFGELTSIKLKIAGNLPKLKRAYVESDGELASAILATYAPIKAECKQLLGKLLHEDLPSREAVATALVGRYLARVGSHLGNIASGIIYPLDKIDFVRSDAQK